MKNSTKSPAGWPSSVFCRRTVSAAEAWLPAFVPTALRSVSLKASPGQVSVGPAAPAAGSPASLKSGLLGCSGQACEARLFFERRSLQTVRSLPMSLPLAQIGRQSKMMLPAELFPLYLGLPGPKQTRFCLALRDGAERLEPAPPAV